MSSASLPGLVLVVLTMMLAYKDLYFQLKSHAYLFEDENEHEEEVATMEIKTAVASLVGITVITSFCADILVEAIDEFALQFDLSKAFIGLILLPIVGNAAEHATSVVMACRGKMEITIGVAVGSSIQISLGVIPLLVVAGWAIDQPLSVSQVASSARANRTHLLNAHSCSSASLKRSACSLRCYSFI